MTRDLTAHGDLPTADQKFLSNINTYGWAVSKVFRRDGEAGPEWAYSTGLFHSYKHPEIITFGLNLDIMHKIVNNIGDEVKIGCRFEPGNEYQQIFGHCGCQFRPVKARFYRDYLGWAIWFYETDHFPTLQCFWPDKEGRYPWDPACNAEVVNLQPLLL